MKKVCIRYIKVLLVLYTLTIISSLLQGCCLKQEKFVGTGYITAYQGRDYNSDLETISGEFYLRVNFDYQIEQVSFNGFNMMSTAYATSCDKERLNLVDQQSFILNVDQEFTYNGNIIDNEYNILELATISADMSAYATYLDIHFTKEFMASATFDDTALTTFTFKSKTSDDISMVFKKAVWIKK